MHTEFMIMQHGKSIEPTTRTVPHATYVRQQTTYTWNKHRSKNQSENKICSRLFLSVKSVKSFNALILPAITLENNNMKEADRGWSSLTGRFYLESH